MSFKKLIFVFLGGGVGAMLRFALSLGKSVFEDNLMNGATLSNVLASFILGLLSIVILQKESNPMWAFLAIGFCGGLSTFSTFAFELVHLWWSDHFKNALFYLLLNLFLSVSATIGGFLTGSYIKSLN